MKVVNFLNSKGMSLFCFFVNCVFAFSAYTAGQLSWFLLSSAFALLCFWNYQSALIREREEK